VTQTPASGYFNHERIFEMEIGLGLIVICLAIACAVWIEKDNKKYDNRKQEK
jgi:hypothetical protein